MAPPRGSSNQALDAFVSSGNIARCSFVPREGTGRLAIAAASDCFVRHGSGWTRALCQAALELHGNMGGELRESAQLFHKPRGDYDACVRSARCDNQFGG
jgi:hypothetical protein